MVGDGTFSHEINYVTIFWEILNLEGHQNRMTGSRVLLNGWILSIVGASAVKGLLPRLVCYWPQLEFFHQLSLTVTLAGDWVKLPPTASSQLAERERHVSWGEENWHWYYSSLDILDRDYHSQFLLVVHLMAWWIKDSYKLLLIGCLTMFCHICVTKCCSRCVTGCYGKCVPSLYCRKVS